LLQLQTALECWFKTWRATFICIGTSFGICTSISVACRLQLTRAVLFAQRALERNQCLKLGPDASAKTLLAQPSCRAALATRQRGCSRGSVGLACRGCGRSTCFFTTHGMGTTCLLGSHISLNGSHQPSFRHVPQVPSGWKGLMMFMVRGNTDLCSPKLPACLCVCVCAHGLAARRRRCFASRIGAILAA
jgi:hypothetical protein